MDTSGARSLQRPWPAWPSELRSVASDNRRRQVEPFWRHFKAIAPRSQIKVASVRVVGGMNLASVPDIFRTGDTAMPMEGPKADPVLSGAERSQLSSMGRSRSIPATISLRARWCRCHAQGKATQSTLHPVSWEKSTNYRFVPATYDRGERAAVADAVFRVAAIPQRHQVLRGFADCPTSVAMPTDLDSSLVSGVSWY